MAKTNKRYAREYRRRLVELVRSGRTPESLGRQYDVPAQSIRSWVRQADLDEGRRTDGLTTAEREELARLRRENKVLREEREILKKPPPGSRRRPTEGSLRVREGESGDVPHGSHVPGAGRLPQRVLRMAFARDVETGSAGRGADGTVRTIHKQSRGTYGVPRIHVELKTKGTRVSRKRVARLMRVAGLQGVSRRKAWKTTVRDRQARPAPDLVERDFSARGPDRLWAADITYIPTWAGFLFLAVVLDVWSRRIVGRAMATHLRTELVLEALNMAVAERQPRKMVHHSDQGCQYTSGAFGQR